MTTSWTGLAAETWDSLGGDEPQSDYEYVRDLVEAQQGPALDVGCGTGRLLVRCLKAGLDVHGIDTSLDMLAVCRAKAAVYVDEPKLFHQSMEALDLPTRYATIFVACGSFMLHLDDKSALTVLELFRKHLAPGGVLAMTFFGPFAAPDPTLGKWTERAAGVMPDGARVTMEQIVEGYDPKSQIVETRRRYTVSGNGKPDREEYLEDRYRWYSAEHISRLVDQAGFGKWSLTGDYSSAELAQGHDVMVLLASD